MQRGGTCMCGATRFVVHGEPLKTAICHCNTCQKWTGSAFAAAAKFTGDQVCWLHDEPIVYPSSEALGRSFCAKCGCSIAFHATDGPVWLNLGLFDDGPELTPDFHLFTPHELPWAHLKDELPRHEECDPA